MEIRHEHVEKMMEEQKMLYPGPQEEREENVGRQRPALEFKRYIS